jgi:hypothetical protein
MAIPESTSIRDLRSRFCERFKCPPSEFEKRALRKCLYLHARMTAPLLRWLNPDCFERDLLFINFLGSARNWEEVVAELDAFRYREHLQPRFTRMAWRLRVSARKANKLAYELFPS